MLADLKGQNGHFIINMNGAGMGDSRSCYIVCRLVNLGARFHCIEGETSTKSYIGFFIKGEKL
jgi:hypothetical protein